jgi:NhaP-type Na+/H+ or K+/H+ antiporter
MFKGDKMRKVGIVLLVAGIGVFLGYLLYWFANMSSEMGLSITYLLRVAIHRMPLSLRVAAGVVGGIGLLALLLAVGRKRYSAAKAEKLEQPKS